MRVHCSFAGKSEQLSEALGLGETELLGNWNVLQGAGMKNNLF